VCGQLRSWLTGGEGPISLDLSKFILNSTNDLFPESDERDEIGENEALHRPKPDAGLVVLSFNQLY
jgi:hypothetical protein